MNGEKHVKVKTSVYAPEFLLEEYRKLLREEPEITELPLVISGNSMSPFLIGGRDTVYLSRVERPLGRGDAVLYQRDNGAYIFHRIYRVTEKGFTMVGDAQTVLEHGIRPDQIIAVLIEKLDNVKYSGSEYSGDQSNDQHRAALIFGKFRIIPVAVKKP